MSVSKLKCICVYINQIRKGSIFMKDRSNKCFGPGFIETSSARRMMIDSLNDG